MNVAFSGRVSRCVHCRREYVVPGGTPISVPMPEHTQSTGEADDDFELRLPEEVALPLEPDPEIVIDIPPPEPPKPQGPAKKIFLGKYEIREKMGEGGMGNVFVAWDTELRREVTVKVLNERGKKLDRFKERFLNEARITGKLEHSGIVPVYFLDYDHRGMPYLVMRLLEGRTLAQLIEQYHHSKVSAFSPETLRELLRHFIDVCLTIAYAHDHFVVHRDIKPKNIMLGGYGETMVIDWGLAKVLTDNNDDMWAEDENFPMDSPHGESPDDSPNLTMIGNRVGTPGYQSPEYLRSGVSHTSDDIYALGVTLYYLLCDRLPQKFSHFEALLTPPVPPHLLNPHVDRPLSAICFCAMAVDQEKRYSKAERLATDLQRWLDGETVSVYRMTWKEKVKLFLRKQSLRIGIALFAFLAGVLFGMWLK